MLLKCSIDLLGCYININNTFFKTIQVLSRFLDGKNNLFISVIGIYFFIIKILFIIRYIYTTKLTWYIIYMITQVFQIRLLIYYQQSFIPMLTKLNELEFSISLCTSHGLSTNLGIMLQLFYDISSIAMTGYSIFKII